MMMMMMVAVAVGRTWDESWCLSTKASVSPVAKHGSTMQRAAKSDSTLDMEWTIAVVWSK
jgi:hypothetical protein